MSLHLKHKIDGHSDLSMSIAELARKSPTDLQTLQSAFSADYPMSGTTDEPMLLPFCKRGATRYEIEQQIEKTKGTLAKAAKRVLNDQKYFGKSYKDIYK